MHPAARLKNTCSPNGIHYLIEFHGCPFQQLDSLEHWQAIMPAAVAGTSMEVLHSFFYPFEPQGLTGFLLLSSSHISVHTWPEKGYAACDLFTCASEAETDLALERLISSITHERVSVQKVTRGFQFFENGCAYSGFKLPHALAASA